MRKHYAKMGKFEHQQTCPDYPVGVIVYYEEGNQTVMVTCGLFKTKRSAMKWGTATVKVYDTYPQAEAEFRELPDDWDLGRVA